MYYQRQQVLVAILLVVFFTCCLCNSLPSIGFPNAQVESHHQHLMWGSYTPYYPVKRYLPPPPDCVVTQVSLIVDSGLQCSDLDHIGQHCILSRLFSFSQSDNPHQLQRHGARFPTKKSTAKILSAVHKLRSATFYTDPSLLFLTNYTYSLGQNDSVPLGALQYATVVFVFLDLLLINLQVQRSRSNDL